MRMFLTGATGYVGGAVADSLREAGHEVSGLARSEKSARNLESRGIAPIPGDMADRKAVAKAARGFEAVVHAAASHGGDGEAADRALVAGILDALDGTGATFVYTSGGWVMGDTPPDADLADEESPVEPAPSLAWRPAVERMVLDSLGRGARPVVVRPALVYGAGGGVLAELVEWAGEASGGVSGGAFAGARFVGGEDTFWTIVHRDDLGPLYEKMIRNPGPAEGGVVIAAGGEPIKVRELAEAADRAAGGPGRARAWPLEEARDSLGEYADSLALSQRLSGEKARRLFGWEPNSPSALEELERGSYGP